MMRPSSTWQGCMQKRTAAWPAARNFLVASQTGRTGTPCGVACRSGRPSADECQGTPPAGLALAEVT